MKPTTKLSLLLLLAHASPSLSSTSNDQNNYRNKNGNLGTNNNFYHNDDLKNGQQNQKGSTQQELLKNQQYDTTTSLSQITVTATKEKIKTKIEVDKLNSKWQKLEKEHVELAQERITLDEAQALLEGKVETIETRITAQEEIVKNLEDGKKIGIVGTGTAAEKKDAQQLKKDLVSANKKLQRLKDMLAETEKPLESIAKKEQNLEQRYEGQKNQLSEIEKEMTRLDGKVPQRFDRYQDPYSTQELENIKLEEELNASTISRMLKNRGVRAVAAIVAILGVTSVIAWFVDKKWFEGLFHADKVEDQKASILKAESSPHLIMKGACVEMQLAALRVDGIVKDKYPGRAYESLLDSFTPSFNLAYANASRAAINKLSTQVLVNWGTPDPFPALAYISNHASVADLEKIRKKGEEDLDTHAVNEWFRPMYLQHQITLQHKADVTEAAFIAMRDSVDLSSATDWDRFAAAYTSTYAWTNIPHTCFGYFAEDKATTARFQDLRAFLATHDADADAALQINFDARSALPATDPLPAVQATA